MDRARASIEFSLQPAGMERVSVIMSRAGTRWLARVDGGLTAVGGSARQALLAALAPMGERRITLMLADLGLLEPSIAVLEMERANASA